MTGEGAESDEAHAIATFIDERVSDLTRRFGSSHPWTNWPRFLYHVTDVTNAASILTGGYLFSRTRAEAAGFARSDNASRRIIETTAPWVLDSVRLYFRPRTPTFFHNEGIRPVGLRSPFDAHCPVPVAFLFDSSSVLARSDIQVSDRNLATRRRRVGNGLDFLRTLPWNWIFHEGVTRGADEQALARLHRNAEVAIPGELPLAGALRFVGVRSTAEFETLRTLLSGAADLEPSPWMSRVHVDSRAYLFFQRWTFVETVVFDGASHTLSFSFNSHTETPAPFAARLDLLGLDSRDAFQEVHEGFRADHSMRFHVPEQLRSQRFRVRLTLDDCLAYSNEFNPTISDLLIRRT